jgi:anaerobic magnesium-protoporphyrin IX monomethyl ester cyclase
MHKAGCRLLCVGFESGDQQILDNINKGIKLATMKQFMQAAQRAGILIHGCFMVGNKGETKETMKKTLEFAQELHPDTAQFFPLMVYPGTRAYQWAKESGCLRTSDYRSWLTAEGLHNCVIDAGELSSDALVAFCDFARRDFYLSLSYIARKFLQMLKNPLEAKRTFKAFKTFARHLAKKQ